MKRILLAICALAFTSCAVDPAKPPLPKCLRNHVEVVRVQDPPTYIKVGSIYIPVTPSPRDEVRTICDEYEQPKGESNGDKH